MISPIHPNKFPVTENIVDRDQLQAAYINRVLDDMDIKDMMAILYDYMDVAVSYTHLTLPTICSV